MSSFHIFAGFRLASALKDESEPTITYSREMQRKRY